MPGGTEKGVRMPKFEMTKAYSAPAGEVFNAAAQAVQNLKGWKVGEVNQAGWYVTGSVSFNFWSYGEYVSVQVTQPAPDQTALYAISSLKFGIVDLVSKNKKNLSRLFAEVDRLLAEKGYAAGQEVAPVAAPGQTDQKFCQSCGAPRRPGAKFCEKCGQPLA